jgi:hypothetical protein
MDISIKRLAAGKPPDIEFPCPPFKAFANEQVSSRDLFYSLMNVDENIEVLPVAFRQVREILDRCDGSAIPSTFASFSESVEKLPEYLERISNWRDEQEKIFRQISRELSIDAWLHLLKQHAPLALVEGCWLQYASSAITSHTNVATALLRIHSYRVGYGETPAHLGNSYTNMLESHGIYLPDISTRTFSTLPDVTDNGYAMPAFELSISQFSRVFLPELLGYNVFKTAYGLCPFISAFQDVVKSDTFKKAYFERFDAKEIKVISPALAVHAIEAYLSLCRQHVKDSDALVAAAYKRVWAGIEAGFRLAVQATDALSELSSGSEFSPRSKMATLVRNKAPHAFGYHKKRVHQGKSLDEWFNPESLDVDKFLDYFAKSPFIKPGDSANSPLLKNLISFKGPMFRIFSDSEIQTISRWIDSLVSDSKNIGTVVSPTVVSPTDIRNAAKGTRSISSLFYEVGQDRKGRTINSISGQRRYESKDLRELYNTLLNIELHPEALFYARQFADEWLARASVGIQNGAQALPFDRYSHEALDTWLHAQHRRQVNSYQENFVEPELTKDQVIRSSVQLCPMVFIDGAWLQKAGSAVSCGTPIGSLLYHIYSDELGNGSTELNHPNVYRELMKQMKVNLPRFEDRAFSASQKFDDSSFEVPVFWLCISQFPKRFLPELLGLNLAMELSGVGGSYRSASDMLKHYGFDPHFIDLHNTIDNVSTGHTAMATTAVKLHMDDMLIRGGRQEVQRQWNRVWTGYRALSPKKGLSVSLRAKAKIMLSRRAQEFLAI